MAGLLFHFGLFVGEDFEGDGTVVDGREQVEGEALVVGDAGGTHERGIGSETLDVRVAVEFENAGLVGAVGEDLHAQVG